MTWSLLGPAGDLAQVILDAEDRRPLAVGPVDGLAEHHARYGQPRVPIRQTSAASLLAELAAIELGGRGGAHFPVARKWRTALNTGGPVVVVGNGAEGEPASAKDAALLELRPHLVIDGLVAAAVALGAESAVLWLHRGAAAIDSVQRALAERVAAGLIEPRVDVWTAPEAYLSGEASAVVRALSGGPALPSFHRRPAAVEGVGGRPTVVQNVETLARIGLLLRTGAAGHAPDVLVSVFTRDAGGEPVIAVRQVPTDRSLAEAVFDAGYAAQGPGALDHWCAETPPRAVLIGGYGGSWVPWHQVAQLELGPLTGRRAHPTLGAGVLIPLEHNACAVAETAAIVAYLARSSARQCGPCVFGTRDLADLWAQISAGSAGRRDLRRLREVAGFVHGRGACALPDAATTLTRSALETFPEDLQQHVSRHPCYRRHRTRLPGIVARPELVDA